MTRPQASRRLSILELGVKLQLLQDIQKRFIQLRRLLIGSLIVGIPSLIAAAAVWYFVPAPLSGTIGVPLMVAALICGALAIAGGAVKPISRREQNYLELQLNEKESLSRRDYELMAQEVRVERRLRPPEERGDARLAYQDDITFYVEELRRRGVRSRRANNIVQLITIIGSLAATAVASLAIANDLLGWFTPAITFIVGTASGIAAIYKFKDRSFYAQQTANAIDQELSAHNLEIGRYAPDAVDDPEVARTRLVEEIHRLRTEQENREQNLDQPAQKSSDAE
jgi:hypothetical protein